MSPQRRKLLAVDFVFIYRNRWIGDKKQALDQMKAGQNAKPELTENLRIRVFGNTAIATGTNTITKTSRENTGGLDACVS